MSGLECCLTSLRWRHRPRRPGRRQPVLFASLRSAARVRRTVQCPGWTLTKPRCWR